MQILKEKREEKRDEDKLSNNIVFILISSSQAIPLMQIPCSLNDLGSRFENDYTTLKVHWARIEQLSISDYGLQANLLQQSETQKSDHNVCHSEPVFEEALVYDVAANQNIEVGSWSVLPVNMDLFGVVEQNFETINPDSFSGIESGITIPQPTTVTL